MISAVTAMKVPNCIIRKRLLWL